MSFVLLLFVIWLLLYAPDTFAWVRDNRERRRYLHELENVRCVEDMFGDDNAAR